MHWGGNISKLSFDIGDELFEDLKMQALKNGSSPEDFIKYCIQQELRVKLPRPVEVVDFQLDK